MNRDNEYPRTSADSDKTNTPPPPPTPGPDVPDTFKFDDWALL